MVIINDYVLVTPEEEEQEQFTPSGLILPQDMKDPIVSGTVINCPKKVTYPNGKQVKSEIQPDQTVHYLRGTGLAYKFGGVNYLLLRYAEIIGYEEPSF